MSNNSKKGKNAKSNKEYTPKEGSGAFAILLTIFRNGPNDFMTKRDIIREGQYLANASFTKPDPGSRYTAWSSMSTLIGKGLVMKRSKPAKYSLTLEGLFLAKKLDKGKNTVQSTDLCDNTFLNAVTRTSLCSAFENGKNIKDEIVRIDSSDEEVMLRQHSFSSSYTTDRCHKNLIENIVDTDSKSQPLTHKVNDETFPKNVSNSSATSSPEDIILPPDTFDIILYVDTCETRGDNIDIHNDPILSKLRQLLVNYEVKSLKVGDYIWICRDRFTKREFILPYIIERKRMDDFAKSIKDGRYHEQKFRLKQSGIQNIIYLIEKYGHTQYLSLPLTTLYQAATNTAIQDGFCIKFTENCKHTAKYLANFSLLMIKMFKLKVIVSCPKENLTEISLNDDVISLMKTEEFLQNSIKNKPSSVSNLFVKMLIQINGMSVDRALAIVQEYPTPATLREAYEHNLGIKGEKLLARIKIGNYKIIGHALSKTVYQLFTLQNFCPDSVK